MGKRLREYFLKVAPEMSGRIENGRAYVLDERTGEQLNPMDIDDKIKIYERQMKEWFLNKATNIMRRKDYGLVGLMVCLAYLEGVQQYRDGESSRGRSEEFLKKSIHRMYPEKNWDDDTELHNFYIQVRCGLFHDGMTRDMVVYKYTYDESLRFLRDTIEVNPKLLLKDIKKDFNKYLKELKTMTNNELRQNFNTMFKLVY